jgi:hypothetical protein
LAVSANFLLQVNSPTAITGATGYNVYVATATGMEVLQNGSTPVPINTTWTEPAGGLLTGTAAAPTTGVPDGAEAVSALQTLARTYVTNGGQVTRSDAYFNLAGLTYSTGAMGTLNTNYYETSYGFDARGRQNMVKSPTNTISRTVYDALGRTASSWVGTNDNGATDTDPTGGGATGNNMVKVSDNAYDTYTTPSAPGLAQTSGGTLAATIYYAKVTYLLNGAETPASPESSLAVSANFLLRVNSPASITGATGYNVYVATATGKEVLQNGATPIALGTNWTEPTTGLVTGTAAPLHQRRRRQQLDAEHAISRRRGHQPHNPELVRLARPPGGEQVGRAGHGRHDHAPPDQLHLLRQLERGDSGPELRRRRCDAHLQQRRAAEAVQQPAARGNRHDLRRPGSRLPLPDVQRQPEHRGGLHKQPEYQQLVRPPRQRPEGLPARRPGEQDEVRWRRTGKCVLHHRRGGQPQLD